MCSTETSQRSSVISAKNGQKNSVAPFIGNVKATIEIFERRTNNAQTKPKVPEKNFTLIAQQMKIKNSDIKVTVFKKEQEIIRPVLPQRKSDSIYDRLKPQPPPPSPQLQKVRSEEAIPSNLVIQPNSSFLWRENKLIPNNAAEEEDWRNTYDFVQVQSDDVQTKTIVKPKMPLPQNEDEGEIEQIYEELQINTTQPPCNGYKETDDGYEYCSKENIYESVPPPLLPRRKIEEPLPPRPPSRNSSTLPDYESIYSTKTDGAYECIYHQIKASDNWSMGSNRDSLLSADQQSNSLYGKAFATWGGGDDVNGGYKAISLSSSERSDEWVDLSDGEDGEREASQEVVM